MDLFSKEYQEHVRNMRKRFFQTGSLEGITGVRQEILACWEAAYLKEITPNDAKKKVASPEEYAAALEQSADLLEVAEPYMRRLYSFLDPESFWVALMDRNGVILKLVGSPTMLKVARATDLVEGSYRGGEQPYPGLYYVCWQLDQPVQIVSGEHPSLIDDGLAGAAAPIHAWESGEFLGVIGVSGYYEKSHGHTLPLTIMAAEAIAQKMALQSLASGGEGYTVPSQRAGVTGLSREAEALLDLLRRHQGNISEVARELGVSRPTIYRNMKKYGINLAGKWMHY